MADEPYRAADELPIGADRLVRPREVVRLRFDELIRGRRSPTNPERGFIPIEAVQPGDVQVLAAREPSKFGSPRIDLDPLAGFPTVESVFASTTIRTERELPQIRELLLSHSTTLPNAATLGKLPGLEAFYAERAVCDVKLAWDQLPGTLRQLALSRDPRGSTTPVVRFTNLRELSLVNLYPGDSVEPVGELRQLTFLRLQGEAKGWPALSRCEALEEAHLAGVRLANLRRYRTWTRLRRLSLCGKGLKSLDGLEAFEGLESLHLQWLSVTSLAPLRGLSRLSELTLCFVLGCHDLGPLAGLNALRRLEISQPTMSDRDIYHVESLKPLAEATALEEIDLVGTAVKDGDLTPLAGLPRLRKIKLCGEINADVDQLRRARPDLTIEDLDLDRPKAEGKSERVGEVTIFHPVEGIAAWSILDDLAEPLGLSTNYAAEKQIREVLRKVAPDVLRRLDFDTEGGNVGIYAKDAADIRSAAAIVDGLIRERQGLTP
jgi:hypothetical protein